MSRLPIRFLGLLSRQGLAEMLARTYAELRDIDTNEAYGTLEEAFLDGALLGSIQQATWDSLAAERPEQDDNERVEMVQQALEKKGAFVAPKKFKDDPTAAAVVVAVEKSIGRSSGEAMDLLETEMGRKLLEKGLRTIGAHLALQLIKKSKRKSRS